MAVRVCFVDARGPDSDADPSLVLFAATTLCPAAELRQRQVRIFKPTKTANSSGRAGTGNWRVDFDILGTSARWENPLMGWASSGDYMQGVYLKFRTKEDAIHFWCVSRAV